MSSTVVGPAFGTEMIPAPIKIVKIVGGRLDGKELRTDRLTEKDAHVGDMQLLLVDDNAPPGTRYAVREYIDGRPVPHAYVVAANSVVGGVRTIVLGRPENSDPAKPFQVFRRAEFESGTRASRACPKAASVALTSAFCLCLSRSLSYERPQGNQWGRIFMKNTRRPRG